MELRVLDELLSPPGRGVVLLSLDPAQTSELCEGAVLTDALGNRHHLGAVTAQDGLYTLHLPEADPAYFERLFRNVFVDATLFTLEPDGGEACPSR